MAEAQKRLRWEPVSMFMCIFANANRSAKRSPFKYEDFFPFSLGEKGKKNWESLPKAKITDLLHIFKGKVKNAPTV